MKFVLCIAAIIFAGLHGFAAVAQIVNSKNKTNDIFMIIGASAALAGAIFCLLNNSIDWLLALTGFALIAYAAIQNGRKKQNFHIRHHIVRVSIATILTIGFFSLLNCQIKCNG